LPPFSDPLWPAVASDNDVVDGGVIALLSRADFKRAYGIIADLVRWSSFEDFLCERDGQFIALSSAGAPIFQQLVPLTAFTRWARLTGCGRTVAALDEFAAMWRVHRNHPDWLVSAALVTRDAIGVLERGSKFGTLLIPVANDIFTEWDRSIAALKLFRNPNSIDRYAALIAEICLSRHSIRLGNK
jgi:hypothetical protein